MSSKCPICGNENCPGWRAFSGIVDDPFGDEDEFDEMGNLFEHGGLSSFHGSRLITAALDRLDSILSGFRPTENQLADMFSERMRREIHINMETGEVQVIVRGHRWEPIPIGLIDAQVIAALEAPVQLQWDMGQKQKTLEQQRQKARELMESIHIEGIELRHAIWAQAPEYRGQRDIEIARDANNIVLRVQGEIAETVTGDKFEQIACHNEALQEHEANLRVMQQSANALQVEIEVMPELIAARKSAAVNYLERHAPELYNDIRQLNVRCTFEDGKLCLARRVVIDEESNQLTAEDADAIRREAARNGGVEKLGPKIIALLEAAEEGNLPATT